MEKIVSLREIIDILKNRIGLILLAGITGVGAAYFFTAFFVTPVYQSTAELITQSKEAATNPAINQQVDINGNLLLINTYKDMIMGDIVLNQVRDELEGQGFDVTTANLRGMINVAQSEQSQMFRITASSDEPEETAAIANTTAKVFQEKARDVLGIDRITITSSAVTPEYPVSPNKRLNAIIGGIMGIALGVAAAFLFAFLDKTVKDRRFIIETVGVPVLGQVSEMNKRDMSRARKIGSRMQNNSAAKMTINEEKKETVRTRTRV